MKNKEIYHSAAAFWVTYVLIIAATIAFVSSSFNGMGDILDGIDAENSTRTSGLIRKFDEFGSEDRTLLFWAALEFDTLENRQARADSLLATRTWLRFMNAAFGSILIMCGAIFILSRVKIDSTNFEAGSSGFKFIFATSSPGICMLVFGAALTTAPLYVSQSIKIDDGFSYPVPYITTSSTISRVADGLSEEQRAEMCGAAKNDGVDDSPYCE